MRGRKFLSLLLAMIVAVSFASCGKNSDEKNKINYWYLGDEDIDFDAVFSSVENINPDDIFASVEITEKMLYGTYAVNNEEKDVKDIRKNMTFKDVEFSDGSVYNISVLPISVSSGPEYICDSTRAYLYSDFEDVTDKDLAVLQFPTKDNIGTVICSYEINGNKITYQALEQTSEPGEKLEYVNDLPVFEYEFSLCGPNLVLTSGTESITLKGFSFTDDCKTDDMTIHGYSLADSPLYQNLDYFCTSESIINYAVDRTGEYYEEIAVKLSDAGTIDIYLKEYDKDPVLKQFAYIANCSGSPYLNNFGLILLDGEKEYFYTDSITMREARQLPENDLSDEEIKQIAEKKQDLFEDLQAEFTNEGINASINRVTGEIILDTAVLFNGDSAVVSDEGKQFLNQFLKAYTKIIYNEKYDGFIEKTVIEGHIAPIEGATYESGLPLSKERAENVKQYCLSEEAGVNVSKFSSSLETMAYSQSKPIYDSTGAIDLDASRRVSFRFIVDIDK